MLKAKKILITPLDWGLGHATRCIPIIRYLLSQGCNVYIAAEGDQALLLQSNFPKLQILPLKGYRISYSKSQLGFAFKIFRQIPSIISSIRAEHKWLEEQMSIHQFDIIISDNRYGIYSVTIPSVIMTHQLRIQSGKGRWIDHILQHYHYKLLNRFNACWVVDNNEQPTLSGILGHPKRLPNNTDYIGLLSQLENITKLQNNTLEVHKKVLVILSGPEPMRSQLEAIILKQATTLHQYQFIIAGGKPEGTPLNTFPTHIQYYASLNAQELIKYISECDLVVCRSGYSTLMDLCYTECKALLIPTPGQTEQEYLAKYLQTEYGILTVAQTKISLRIDIENALNTQPLSGLFDKHYTQMKKAIDKLILS